VRIVILASSVYSETGCAMAVRMAELGYIPAGALALSSLNRGTLLRKLAQWGPRDVARYARAKIGLHHGVGRGHAQNPYLEPLLKRGDKCFRNLRQLGRFYDFPVVICRDQNAAESIARLREWAPDLIIFTGGNILRKPLLAVPCLGVLNVHLGLLPQVRGMSSPEWSLLKNIPVGITIHYVDAGIDTGPILQRSEFPDAKRCGSLSELRNRLIAFGVEQIGNVVSALDRGALSATPQPNQDKDNQFFVMHERLQTAAERLAGAMHE
jgi:folate-dependent phosphoribosylglycinamide formyltransferase PurN